MRWSLINMPGLGTGVRIARPRHTDMGVWLMGLRSLPLILMLANGCLGAAQAADDGQDLAGGPASRPGSQHTAAGSSLEGRVTTLAKFLDLSAAQQSDLRKVLENQRDQVSEVWRGSTVPPAYRVSATRAISDKTADQIRALLTDEQKKKYGPRREPHEATAGHSGRSADDWMKETRSKLSPEKQ